MDGSAGTLDLTECRAGVAANARSLRKLVRRAAKYERDADAADEDGRAVIGIKLTSVNAQTNALKAEQSALRAAYEMAKESAKLEIDARLIAESEAQREADGAGAVH